VEAHSEAAALLLIWAANQIKQYACSITLGIQPDEANASVIKMDDMHKVSTRTKVNLKKEARKCKTERQKGKTDAKEALNASPMRSPEKSKGIFGQFLPAKKADFSRKE
jgi:hypothetical protein